MPIFLTSTQKLAILSEDKTKGVQFEYDKSMTLEEIKVYVDELQLAIVNGIKAENEKKEADAKAKETKENTESDLD